MSNSNSSNSSNFSESSDSSHTINILGVGSKRKVDDYKPKITDAPKKENSDRIKFVVEEFSDILGSNNLQIDFDEALELLGTQSKIKWGPSKKSRPDDLQIIFTENEPSCKMLEDAFNSASGEFISMEKIPVEWARAPVKAKKGSKSKGSKNGLKIKLSAPRKLYSELLAVVDFNNPTWAPVKTVVRTPLSDAIQGTNLSNEFEEFSDSTFA